MQAFLRAFAVVAAAGVLVAGCGSDDPEPTGAAPTGTTSAASSPSATESAAPVERTLGKTGWYAGFAVTVDSVTATEGFGGVDVELALTYENLTRVSASPSTAAHLEYEGQVVPLSFDSPMIPGEGSAPGTATASVPVQDPTATATPEPVDVEEVLDGTVLVYGEAADNQTMVPLSTDGAVESFEPLEFPATGRLGSPVVVELVAGRAQPSYQRGEKGLYEISLQFTASCAKGCQASGYNIDRTSFSLKTPSGESVNPDARSPWCCEAMYPGTVVEGEDTVITFVVHDEPGGKYTFSFLDPAKDKMVSVPLTI